MEGKLTDRTNIGEGIVANQELRGASEASGTNRTSKGMDIEEQQIEEGE